MTPSNEYVNPKEHYTPRPWTDSPRAYKLRNARNANGKKPIRGTPRNPLILPWKHPVTLPLKINVPLTNQHAPCLPHPPWIYLLHQHLPQALIPPHTLKPPRPQRWPPPHTHNKPNAGNEKPTQHNPQTTPYLHSSWTPPPHSYLHPQAQLLGLNPPP